MSWWETGKFRAEVIDQQRRYLAALKGEPQVDDEVAIAALMSAVFWILDVFDGGGRRDLVDWAEEAVRDYFSRR
jgi:hypothetical protein